MFAFMNSQKRILFIALLSVLLTACSSAALTPTAVSTSATAVASPYDGLWQGQGSAQDGRQITVKFTVQNGAISSFSYTYLRPDNVPCTGIDHSVIPAESQPRIASAAFSKVFGPDLTASGSFTSPQAASGNIAIVWQGRAYLNSCNASLQAAWTAVKGQAAQNVVVAPVASAWCGKNVNCNDLLTQLLIFGLVNGAILALNAIGVTVIYSTVRMLNLAHGDVFALTTAFVTSTINIIGLDLSWPLQNRILILAAVLAGAVVFGALLSMGVEALAFRPFRGRSRLAPLIASLGISFILFQGALVWRTYQKSFIRGEHRSVPGLNEVPTDGIPNFLSQNNLFSGHVILQFSDAFVLITAIVFVILATYLLSRTSLGRSIRAVAQNEELAEMVGVDRDRAIRRAFALGGALAGAAAFIFALYYSRPFGQDGAESGLFAFAAALMGGIGSPLGALISSILLGLVGSFSDYFLSAQWTPVLLLGLLAALLVWRRGGLLNQDEGAEETGVRDSVVLTAPVDSQRARRYLIALLLVLALLPLFSSLFNLGAEVLLRGLGIFILLTLGLNILLGLSGVLDLGYAMSFAIGGYTAAILTNRYGLLQGLKQPFDFIFVLFISAGVTALFGALKGGFASRLRGDYLAVATLALGLMTQDAIVNGGHLTGSSGGLSPLPAPYLFGWTVAAPAAQYYLVLGFVVLAAFASGRLISSRTGRAWIASSEDETAAQSSGVNASRYRLLAFIFSSALAGAAGALYASTFNYIDPSVAAFDVSAMMLAMVILGGAGSVSGAILGTLLIYSYDKVIIPQLAALIAVLWPKGVYIGMVPDIRGTNFFNFGIALYLTVLWRARARKGPSS